MSARDTISVMKLALRHSDMRRSDLVLSAIIVFAAFLGAAHILIRTSRYGILINPDSLVYTHFAETLAAGDWFEGRLVNWPPFMSVLLAFFRLFGIEPTTAGRFLNIMGFGFIILVISYWLNRYVKFRFVVVGTAVIIGISYPVTHMASWMLAELLFTLIVLLALVQMESFLSDVSFRYRMASSIVLSALAPLTRWIGITVILTGIILIITRRNLPARSRWRYVFFYSSMSLLPLILWLIRNWIARGTLFRSFASTNSLWDGLSQWDDIFYLIVFVGLEPGWLEYLLWIIVALMLYETANFLHQRNFFFPHQNIATFLREKKSERSIDNLGARPCFPFVIFTIVYLLVLFLSTPSGISDTILLRYFGPPYVTVIVPVAVWLDRSLSKTYQNSGLLVEKSADGWVVAYDRFSGRTEVAKFVLYGLILVGILNHCVRHIERYLSVLVTYNPIYYQV